VIEEIVQKSRSENRNEDNFKPKSTSGKWAILSLLFLVAFIVGPAILFLPTKYFVICTLLMVLIVFTVRKAWKAEESKFRNRVQQTD